jgi:serine phosphatase RsbU (regulator of sigma subunit)
MSKEIMDYISKIDIKVKERTATIEKQFNEIEKQRFELTQTNYKLVENNIELKKSKKVIEQKNEEILDSLRYAQRIQRTLMPSLNFLKTKVPNSFIYFLPKDIVSGDFYFIHESEEMLFIAIADCTGHGVPGAFMSFIAIHALQREIIDKKETDTGKILTGVNKTMNNDSKNDSEQIYDGMDIALCCINRKTNELSFSGANIPIWITSFSKHYSSNEKNCYSVKTNSTNLYLTEIKADKQPIGRYINSIDFSTTKMQLVANDHFYIFTDGYADQFGGVNGKKYKYSNLRKLLVAIKEKDIDEQKKAIREDFTNWKNKLEQLDDICVFGYEIN